jgi:hypothetical protein
VKKLISIGVALALLTMAVVPGVAAAQYTEPDTYAKVPFAIIQSGLELIGDIIGALPEEMGIPAWISDITDTIAPWAGGPLSWTVDMLGWGIWLVGDVIGALDSLVAGLGVELPFELSEISAIFNTIACDLFTPWAAFTGPAFDPCGP